MLWARGSLSRARTSSVPRGFPRIDDGDHSLRHRNLVLANYRSVPDRRGWLSGRHLAARRVSGGGFWMCAGGGLRAYGVDLNRQRRRRDLQFSSSRLGTVEGSGSVPSWYF
jgi:hypothetical protein